MIYQPYIAGKDETHSTSLGVACQHDKHTGIFILYIGINTTNLTTKILHDVWMASIPFTGKTIRFKKWCFQLQYGMKSLPVYGIDTI